MLALIEMNLLPGGKRGAGRPKAGRKPALPKFAGLRDVVKGDPWVILVSVLTLVAVGHLAFTYVNQSVTLQRTAEELDKERQDSIRYAAAIDAADSLQARRDTLIQKARIIREIDQDRFVWAHILDQVSAALPDFTWLIGLQQTAGTGNQIEFRIDGMTGATRALTAFMRDLEESPFIRDVRLVSQEQTQQGQRLVQSFVLMARYQVPDSSVIQTEPIILAGE
jgi:Tfp pilus assembly protein PilN